MSNPLLFFGRLHPLLVHLPIGFLTLLALVELANRIHRFRHAAQARGIILVATVAASVVTVACGLMLATGGGYDGGLLFWHKWMGISLALFVIATAWSFFKGRHKLYTGLLVATLAIMAPASHFGGSMTHGRDYLTAYAPTWLGGPSPSQPAIVVKKKLTDPMQADLFADIVQPVLQQNCLACHGSSSISGGLRLDTYAFIRQGGHSGTALLRNDADHSLMLQRMLLSIDQSNHMPPAEKPQPTDDQIAAIRWWIDNGAPEQKKIGDLHPGPEQNHLVVRLLQLPPPVDMNTPKSLADMAPQIAEATAHTGALIQPVAIDQPWLVINASVARTFGDHELAALIPIGKNITVLNLAGTKITDTGLTAIAQMPNLTDLKLERTAITDVGLKNLAQLRKLDYLNLYGTPVTDAGLETLKSLPALRHLYLWKTKVDPQDAQKFADAKTDKTKIARMQQQIATLQAEITAQHVEVIGGIPGPPPATKPTTMPVNKSATAAAH